ncbi:Carboxypeptidase regulatory-like domain-containing protein [Actinoplanes philippinensis]|uniref:Carboxypeptidase regulatory-like domain-containing protein n=1 Tax=Actinoplanes philippinensis TaxID=35752 RepID=A0A1I2II12_9ACTN|nr:carboxypeptidase regulatory-like domain-containing protein [Actinoplanes philippinensis]SFF41293.1 Carboxypeptidase regulatory-like domain-containing protein [Actinoplanes philippinensis]
MIRSLLVRLGGVLTAGLLLAGGLTAPAAAAAGAGAVEGVFTDHAGAPIADAWVVAWGAEDGSYLAGTGTDATGRYRLTDVPQGPVKLSFQTESLLQWAPGALSQETGQVYQVPAGGTLTVDERRRPTGVIEGAVTGPDGSPAAWIPVDVRDLADDSRASTYTDDAGKYRLTVWAGDHHVGFGPDAAKQWAPRATSEDEAGRVSVAAGATVAVDEALLPTGTFRGRLSAVDGSPLAWAEVLLYSGDRRIHGGYTGDDGTYAFPVLPGGYVLGFQADPNGAEQYIPGAVDRSRATVHTVAAGQTVVADDAVLKPASVSGRLTGPDGTGKADFQVSVTSTDDEHGYGATTTADGSWRVDDVFPSDYRVSFTNPSGSRTQWAHGRSNSGDAAVITVEGGAQVVVDDTWLTGATLAVRAVDEVTGAPVTDFCVQVEASGGFDQGCAVGGTATVADVTPGAALVDVVPGEDTYFLRDRGNPVTLVTGETATITVPLAKGGKVSFAVTDRATGRPAPETCFVLTTIGGGGLPDGYGDCTGSQGTSTSAALAPGTYEAFAVAPDEYGHQWVGRTGGTGDQKAAARIVVEADRTVPAPPVLLDRAGSITGVVEGADGAPIEDADVSLTAWGFGPGPIHSVHTDDRGRYTIGKLGPYAWPLSFTAPGHPRQWSGNVGDRFTAAAIPVTAGATATYDITLATGATLAGKVVVPAGLPADGWRLTVTNAVTGDQMADFDSSGQGPGGTYRMPVIGGQPVRISWIATGQGNTVKTGWYDRATSRDDAKRVNLPASGTKRVTVTLG